jgi:hypothetical protein
MDLKEAMASKEPVKPEAVKGASPEMRIAYALHLMERKRKEEEEPVTALRKRMEEVGASVAKVTKNNRGFEVVWQMGSYKIASLFDKEMKVINAGFCVNSGDRVLSARSMVHVMEDGLKRGIRVNVTRSVN